MTAAKAGPSPDERRLRESLVEIQRRLVRIHYSLAASPHVEPELHRRTVERLMDVLNYVEEVATAEQPAKA
jgi:hypothetical protein